MIEAELHDGRVLEFPDGTDPAVIQATVKKLLGGSQPEAPAPKPEATTGERAQALVGGVNRGIAGIAGLPMDTVENVYNLAKAGAGTVAGAVGRPDLMPELTKGTPLSSEWFAELFNKLGQTTTLPRPDDPASRMLYRGGTVVGGSMVPGARPSAVLPAAAGAAVAGEVSDNPLAPAVGAMLPAAGAQAGRDLKASLQGNAAQNIKTFNEAGTQPSLGQATENKYFQGLETLLSKIPGGMSVFKSFAEKQQQALKPIVGESGAETAGRAIEKGITGRGGFLETTKKQWQTLDQELANKVPSGTGVAPAETMAVLDKLVKPIAGAEQTSTVLRTGRLSEIRDALNADVQKNGVIPFEGLRELRARVGMMLDDSMTSNIPNGEIKALYGALSKDMKSAAQAAGPEALAAFNRQSNYYRARQTRIDDVLSRVLDKDPEKIFKAVTSGTNEGATTLRAVMRSLPKDAQQVLVNTVVDRMGRTLPSRQTQPGEFSTETFLTNYQKLSPQAKQQLFSDSQMRADMDSLSQVASNIRSGSKVFANPSGTAGALFVYGLGSAAVAGLLTGNVSAVVGPAAIVGASNVGARLMTNPKFVNWFAQVPKLQSDAQTAAHLARLNVVFNSADEGTKRDIAEFISGFNETLK